MPYKVHTVLTDNGTHFTTPGNVASAASIIKEAIAAGETFRAHSFELACARNDIDHRLTKPRRPWTTDEVEQSPCCDPCYFVVAHGRPRDEEPGSRCKPGRAVFIVAPPLRRPWVRAAHAGSSPRSGVGRRPPPA